MYTTNIQATDGPVSLHQVTDQPAEACKGRPDDVYFLAIIYNSQLSIHKVGRTKM